MIKVAIIGCGGIGRYHLGHLLQFTDFTKVVGVCDLIESRAEDFAAKTGAKAYTDFKVMYDEVNRTRYSSAFPVLPWQNRIRDNPARDSLLCRETYCSRP